MNLETFKRNTRLEGVFNRAAPTYNTIGPNYFTYFGNKLVEYAKINEGRTLLDVACGKGASLLPAAHHIGNNGQVIGIDFSEQMLKETQSLIYSQGVINTKVMQMDAENLDFPENNFDYVLCGLSIAFFSNSLVSVGEMHRVLKDNGKLGLSTWKRRDKPGVLDKAYKTLFPQNPDPNLNNNMLRPDFSSIDGINNILKNAGFKNIEIFEENKTFYYKDEAEWWNEQWTTASRGLFERVESLGPDAIKKFKKVAFTELMKYKDDNGIRFDADILFSFGHK